MQFFYIDKVSLPDEKLFSCFNRQGDNYKKERWVILAGRGVIKQAGYKPDETTFIAGSALKGDNIANKSDKMAWYKGPTVLEQIDKFPAPEKPTGLPMRMPAAIVSGSSTT